VAIQAGRTTNQAPKAPKGPNMEKFIIIVGLYFLVVQFVFPKLGLRPG